MVAVVQRHVLRRARQLQPGQDAGQRRVGARRAVAVEVRQHMNVLRQKGDILRLAGHAAQNGVQHLIDGLPRVFACASSSG